MSLRCTHSARPEAGATGGQGRAVRAAFIEQRGQRRGWQHPLSNGFKVTPEEWGPPTHIPHRGPRESGGRTMPGDGGGSTDSGPRTGWRGQPQPRGGFAEGVTVRLPAAQGGGGVPAALTEGLEVLDR